MVVTIGPDWENPRGGIAQVLKTYSTIYNPFSVIITSKSGNLLCNLYQFFKAINELLFRYNKKEKLKSYTSTPPPIGVFGEKQSSSICRN